MSIVLAIAGKKYTITSSSVDNELLAKAAALYDEAIAEVTKKDPATPEGQLCTIAAMRCLVPLLKEKAEFEATIDDCLKEIPYKEPD